MQAWGSLKVWNTRDLAWITRLPDGTYIPNNSTNEEDAWSFGQTLPLVLVLLPILAMFQSYRQPSEPIRTPYHN